jgi:hypothetical protein
LSLQPITPVSTDETENGPYVAMWAAGYIHGSFANKLSSRVSVTLPITTIPPLPYERARISKRLRMLQSLNPLTPEPLVAYDRKIARSWIQKYNIPYADGPTHYKPSKEYELLTHGFESLLPLSEVVEEFIVSLG